VPVNAKDPLALADIERLQQHVDRGLGSPGMNYEIAPDAFWSLAWRKGRQDGAFDVINAPPLPSTFAIESG